MHVVFSSGISCQFLGQFWGHFSGQQILLNYHPDAAADEDARSEPVAADRQSAAGARAKLSQAKQPQHHVRAFIFFHSCKSDRIQLTWQAPSCNPKSKQ